MLFPNGFFLGFGMGFSLFWFNFHLFSSILCLEYNDVVMGRDGEVL